MFLETRLIGDQLLKQVKDVNIVFQLCVNTTIKSIIWQVCTSVVKPDLFLYVFKYPKTVTAWGHGKKNLLDWSIIYY